MAKRRCVSAERDAEEQKTAHSCERSDKLNDSNEDLFLPLLSHRCLKSALVRKSRDITCPLRIEKKSHPLLIKTNDYRSDILNRSCSHIAASRNHNQHILQSEKEDLSLPTFGSLSTGNLYHDEIHCGHSSPAQLFGKPQQSASGQAKNNFSKTCFQIDSLALNEVINSDVDAVDKLVGLPLLENSKESAQHGSINRVQSELPITADRGYHSASSLSPLVGHFQPGEGKSPKSLKNDHEMKLKIHQSNEVRCNVAGEEVINSTESYGKNKQLKRR